MSGAKVYWKGIKGLRDGMGFVGATRSVVLSPSFSFPSFVLVEISADRIAELTGYFLGFVGTCYWLDQTRHARSRPCRPRYCNRDCDPDRCSSESIGRVDDVGEVSRSLLERQGL